MIVSSSAKVVPGNTPFTCHLIVHILHVHEPSSAIRNAKEIANVLIDKYGVRVNVPPM